MANVIRDGTHDARVAADVFPDFVGRSPNLGIPFRQGSIPVLPLEGFRDGTVIDVGHTGDPKVIDIFNATHDLRVAGSAYDWFEEVHLVPREKIDFGQIISLEQDEYELYNAYRQTDITLVSIVNNATPGIELPNVTPPVVIEAQSSLLDPTSTGNSGGVGLGTLVKTKINALAEGLPAFDTSVDFSLSDGDTLKLLVAGSRLVFIPMDYEAPAQETLAFLTDIIESINGKEQRLALRKQPRQLFEVEYILDSADRRRMQVLLMDWTDSVFGFPLQHEVVQTTAAVGVSATVYPITQGDVVDFRVGGLAVAVTDANTFDVINIAAVTATTLTAADPSLNAYPAGTRIYPMRTARILGLVPGRRHVNNCEVWKITFEVTDNDTGAPAGSTTPGFWSLYNGKVLFSDANVVDANGMDQQITRLIYRVDNETGIVNASSPWDVYKRIHRKGFVARSRAEIMQLRKLMLALRGRQTSFYIPTFIEDMVVVATLGMGTATMDIENIEYARFAANRDPKKTFRITFTDGTSLMRVVQSSSKISSTVERLTLDTTWPATRLASEVSRVEFFELVRFDSDDVVFNYPRIGLAECVMPVKAVFE